MPDVVIDRDRCKGCELCVLYCPQQILGMSKAINSKGYFYSEVKKPERCLGCLICAVMCPDVAITIRGNAVQYRLYDYFQAGSAPRRASEQP